jgi:isocitrate dehydrogenase (NAD+)
MLRHLGEPEAALKIRNALEYVYRDKKNLTKDVGGSATTTQFTDAIIAAMETQPAASAVVEA